MGEYTNNIIQCAAELRSRHRASPGVQRSWKKKSIENSSKRHGKSEKKSIENPSKIHRKSIKIDAPGAHFGMILGVWAPSGLQAHLGQLLGRFLVDFMFQHGSNLRPKMEPKSIKKLSKKWSKNWHLRKSIFFRFWWIFGRKMEATWDQNRFKNGCQLRNCDFHETLIKQTRFHTFFDFLGSIFEAKMTKKTILKWSPRWNAS